MVLSSCSIKLCFPSGGGGLGPQLIHGFFFPLSPYSKWHVDCFDCFACSLGQITDRNTDHMQWHTNKNFIETNKKLFTFDVSTSIRGLHQKKLVLGLLPVLGATS